MAAVVLLVSLGACASDGSSAEVAADSAVAVTTPTAIPTTEPLTIAEPAPTPAPSPTPVASEVVETWLPHEPGPGVPCPADADPSPGTIFGVNEWVNARSAPSLSGEIVGRFDLDQAIEFYAEPWFEGGTAGWVAVQQPNPDRCLYVSADFITTATGPLDRAPAGITYELPATGDWLLWPRAGATGRTLWLLDDGLHVGVFIEVAEGKHIDKHIESQQAIANERGVELETGWRDETEVAGADRALLLTNSLTRSGDLFLREQHLEVGDYTITIGRSVYHEDVGVAPVEAMRMFFDSVTVDREVFLAALENAVD